MAKSHENAIGHLGSFIPALEEILLDRFGRTTKLFHYRTVDLLKKAVR